MHIFPTDKEVEKAAELLVNKYDVSAQLLGRLFGINKRNQANSILQSLGEARLTALDIARLLVQREGPNLFAGNKKMTRKLRLHLLQKLSDKQVRRLYSRHPLSKKKISSPSYMRRPLAEKRWHSGKHWARDFVSALGFPSIFAGVVQAGKVPTIHDVQPHKVPPNLTEFQIDLKKRMREVLDRDGNRTRCIVTLPTGGGKTRVAVEAFIDWMQPRFATGKYLIWIAQSEELCEQSIACIEQMWSSREFVKPLRIYRFFGGRCIPCDELQGGALVGSIQQLHSRIKDNDEALELILKDTGAMIIDEAHRAVSSMYDILLRRSEYFCGPDLFPICGLTATPGRAGIYQEQPLEYFREKGYLARARHIIYRSGREYSLTDDEVYELERVGDLPAGFLKRLAADNRRNLLIVRRLLRLPKKTPTLIYACTVNHAYFLSVILTAQGRKSAAISANTPATLRRAIIHDFKKGKLEFLCNYGVLTTGFDAPKTKCIALCRPTMSEVLYEQIIGRGLRGPNFNGTPECMIIDFADNIRRLGPPLAYARFADFWCSEKEEC